MWGNCKTYWLGNNEVDSLRSPQAWPIEWTCHQDNWVETEKVISNIVFFCHVEVRWGYYGKLETDIWSKGDSYFGGYDEVDIFRIPQVWPIRWANSQEIWLETGKVFPILSFLISIKKLCVVMKREKNVNNFFNLFPNFFEMGS